MATQTSPYQNYTANKVMSASREELTLMLYEGALKFCNQAIIALNDKDYVKSNSLIKRVCDIIIELQKTLDSKFALAKNFDQLYYFVIQSVTEAGLTHEVKLLEDARDIVRGFRDMWKEAMQEAKKQAQNH
jgi:flagellar protein FliS